VTNLKFNKEKQISEGILIEKGIYYYVQFKDGKEISGSRKLKYGGARIMIIGKLKFFYFFIYFKF
jgi:hypothetical protein